MAGAQERAVASIGEVIAWIVLGLIAGAVAKFLMPGRDQGGLIATIVIGIVGAVIGGFIGKQLNLGTVTGFNWTSIGLAILGALVLILGLRLVRR